MAPPGVGSNQQIGGVRVTLASFAQPPTTDGGDGEGGGFVRDAHAHDAAVGLQIEDAIQNGHALGLRAEVVIVDRGGRALPLGACVLKIPHQFPLFGIHTDHRIPLTAETPAQFVNLGELYFP